MSNKEVVNFIKSEKQPRTKLFEICEKLFDRCLSFDLMGSGIDNMNVIIATYRS